VTLALWNKNLKGGIAVNVTALDDDRELDLLVRHLLITFKDRTLLTQREIELEGHRARGVVLDGWIEGENVIAEAYVLKDEGVVYDLVAWSPPDAFPTMEREFHAFLDSIRFLNGGGPR